MNRLGRSLLGIGVLCGGAYVAWRALLTEEARRSLKETAMRIHDVASQIEENIDNRRGIYMDDDLPNRETTMRDWENLGIY